MAPPRQKSRDSGPSAASRRDDASGSSSTKIPLKGSSSPRTPQARSPIQKRRKGISLQQKQALIDNLQLEVTERARRLRAQYNLLAQGLRSRIEIRINRIPTSLRKAKMGDLVLKFLEQERSRAAADAAPPLLPAKEAARPEAPKPSAVRSQAPERVYHAAVQSEHARDKENEVASLDGKKKARPPQGTDGGPVRPAQVLSPTSSNSRLTTRDRPPASPAKSQLAQPGSPLKSHGAGSRSAAVTGVLSSMVERAKATRHASTRKVTTTSAARCISNSSATATATATATAPRGRRPVAAGTTSKAAAAATTTTSTTNTTNTTTTTTRPVTRAGGRASGTSESSEGSTTTIVRKAGTGTAAAAAAAAAATKKRTMGAIRRGVAGGGPKKTAAKAAAPPAATKAGGRVLRKRA